MKELLDISPHFGMPEGASAHAGGIDYMMSLVHWLMLLLFVGWGVYFIYALIRFRAGKNPRASYAGAGGKYAKFQETGVVLAETLLLLGFAFPIYDTIKNDFPAAESATQVHVIAEQFAWNIHYPGADGVFGQRRPDLVDLAVNPIGIDPDDPNGADDLVTLNELNLPVNKPVIVTLSSKDVIHAFALPQMRVKQDAIPGIEIPLWFVPTQTGNWQIGCAQLCGSNHFRMRGFLTIQTQEEFEAWQQEMADLG